MAATTGVRRAELCAARLRKRIDLDHLDGPGLLPAAVAMRAGHDPSAASNHYTGKIDAADRALASAWSTVSGRRPPFT